MQPQINPFIFLGHSNENRAHKSSNNSSYLVQHIRTNEAGLVPSRTNKPIEKDLNKWNDKSLNPLNLRGSHQQHAADSGGNGDARHGERISGIEYMQSVLACLAKTGLPAAART